MTNPKFNLSAHYGSVHKTGDVYSARFDRLLNHPVKKVWEALTIPEKIAQWLSPNHKTTETEIDLRVGGKVRMQFMMAVSDGEITMLEREKVLEITWSKENISRWQLFEEGADTCRLVFTEILPVSFFQNAAPAYHGYLDFLSLALDEKEIPTGILEEWHEISKDATERYTEMLNKIY